MTGEKKKKRIHKNLKDAIYNRPNERKNQSSIGYAWE